MAISPAQSPRLGQANEIRAQPICSKRSLISLFQNIDERKPQKVIPTLPGGYLIDQEKGLLLTPYDMGVVSATSAFLPLLVRYP